MTVGETIEFDVPAPDLKLVRKSGKLIELLPNGRMRVEIMVGGETTTMLIDPNRQQKAPKPKREKKKEPSINLFDSAMQEMRDQIEELKARVPKPVESPAVEPLHDDITEETIILPVMYREDILGPMPKYRTLQRHHVGDSRYYVQQFEQPDGSWSRPQLYNGVTSIGKATLPTPKERIEWWCSFPTYEDAQRALFLLSAKGTVMHTLIAKSVQGVLPDFGTADMDREIRREISNQGISPNEVIGEWLPFFYKALMGFKQFCYDRHVVFLAVEIVLGLPHDVDANGDHIEGYFGQLDFIVEMDLKHYQDGFLRGRREKLPEKPTNGRKPSKKDFNARIPFVSHIPASTDWEWSSGDVERFCERIEAPITFARNEDFVGFVDESMATESLREVAIPQKWIPYPNAMLPEDRERVVGIIDAKSGKHDFPDHDLQLGLQIPLVKRAYPNFDWSNLRVYNWHPSDYRESAISAKIGEDKEAEFGYTLLDKTKRMNQRWIDSVLNMWRENYVKPLPMKAIYQGSPNINVPPSDNIRFADYATYWEEKIARAIEHKFADL